MTMSSQKRLRYSDFWDRINVDAFEEAIGFTPEEQRGSNDVGFCLWPENHAHGDTTGKFAIEREARIYNCYVCGGGNLLSLAMELYDFDVEDATSWIYQFAEADLRTDQEFVDDFLDAFRDVEKRVDTLPYFNERVLEKFPERPPFSWLDARGISDEVCEQYNLLYSDKVYRPSPKNGRFAEEANYEGPGIILPHYWKGRLVGWQTRWLDEDRPEWVPKYTMTSDFPKETTVYGADQMSTNLVFVVESVPSALYLASSDMQAIATFGSNVNEAQLRVLRKFDTVVLCPDNDPAGEKWGKDLTKYLKRYTNVYCLAPVDGPGSDIGDLANREFGALQNHLLTVKVPGIEL